MNKNLPMWRSEFPSDFAVPCEIEALVENGVLIDQSWHNDTCPSFQMRGTEIVLWIDHPEIAQREFPDEVCKRFTIGEDQETILATDNLPEVIRFIEKLQAAIARSERRQ